MKRIVFGESVQGASHKRNEMECQDSMKKVEFEDGSVEYFELMDHGYDQIVFFDSPHWGKSITFTIESVYPGSRYSDTCISEIFLARGDWAYSSTTTMIYAELLY